MSNEPEQATPQTLQTEEQTAETPEYREISPDEVKKILEQHRKWVEPEGKEGKGADLGNAHMEKADLVGAHLEEANLGRAYLEEADLREAHLEEAILERAHLEKADLREANLTGATSLTQAQLNQACADENTTLPEGLTRPKPCSEEDLPKK